MSPPELARLHEARPASFLLTLHACRLTCQVTSTGRPLSRKNLAVPMVASFTTTFFCIYTTLLSLKWRTAYLFWYEPLWLNGNPPRGSHLYQSRMTGPGQAFVIITSSPLWVSVVSLQMTRLL